MRFVLGYLPAMAGIHPSEGSYPITEQAALYGTGERKGIN